MLIQMIIKYLCGIRLMSVRRKMSSSDLLILENLETFSSMLWNYFLISVSEFISNSSISWKLKSWIETAKKVSKRILFTLQI